MTVVDYQEIHANVTVSHTEASGPDLILTGNPFTLVEDTRLRIEFYTQVFELQGGYCDLNLGVYEGPNLLRLLLGASHHTSAGQSHDFTGYGVNYLTLAAGTHTLAIKAYISPGSTAHGLVAAGSGVGDDFPPAFYQVTLAEPLPV